MADLNISEPPHGHSMDAFHCAKSHVFADQFIPVAQNGDPKSLWAITPFSHDLFTTFTATKSVATPNFHEHYPQVITINWI